MNKINNGLMPIMPVLPFTKNDEILVLPLGGVGRIGLNWTLYGFHDKWFLVDAGIGFPEQGQTGEYLIIDPDWVRSISPYICALILTHAHEDHIGAVPKLWPDYINCPIWATPYCASIVKEKLSEIDVLEQVEIKIFSPGDKIFIGDFSIGSIAMSHSTPESTSLIIEAGGKRILHTGDWKDDPDPLIGASTDWDALKAMGDSGVDLLVCDSTNAEHDIPLTSEKDVLAGFRYIMSDRKGMVVVACFGSNIARVSSAVRAASEAGRFAAISGRSMKTSEAVARKLGMLDHIPEFLCKPGHLRELERNQMALVCTGSQGEENAALWRMARNEMVYPKLQAGDTVIISSRAIPTRQEGITALIEALVYMGVEVLTAADSTEDMVLHATGHAGRGEISRMHQIINPSYILPVHGNIEHLTAHGCLAHASGIQYLLPEEGDIFSLSENKMKKSGNLIPAIAIMDRNIPFLY